MNYRDCRACTKVFIQLSPNSIAVGALTFSNFSVPARQILKMRHFNGHFTVVSKYDRITIFSVVSTFPLNLSKCEAPQLSFLECGTQMQYFRRNFKTWKLLGPAESLRLHFSNALVNSRSTAKLPLNMPSYSKCEISVSELKLRHSRQLSLHKKRNIETAAPARKCYFNSPQPV